MAKLIVIGHGCGEVNLPPHEPPPPGEVVTVPGLELAIGGSGVVTAITTARLGISTAFSGVLGDDVLGVLIRDTMSAEGVDVTRLHLLQGRSSPTTLVYNRGNGHRPSFVQHPGTNADYKLPSTVLRAPCKVFHLAAPEFLTGIWPHTAIDIVRKLKVAGRTVSLDTFAMGNGRAEIERNVKEHRHLLDLVDIVFPNEEEARLISGRSEWESMVRYFHERGVQIVAIKRGDKGAVVSWGGRIEEVQVSRVEAVDTRGAGDNFAAGFLAGYLRGLDPLKCTRLACALGMRCVRHQGALTGTRDRKRMQKALTALEGQK